MQSTTKWTIVVAGLIGTIVASGVQAADHNGGGGRRIFRNNSGWISGQAQRGLRNRQASAAHTGQPAPREWVGYTGIKLYYQFPHARQNVNCSLGNRRHGPYNLRETYPWYTVQHINFLRQSVPALAAGQGFPFNPFPYQAEPWRTPYQPCHDGH